MTAVDPRQWRQAVTEAVAAGFQWPEVLCATDHGVHIAVLATLRRPTDAAAMTITMQVPAGDVLPSVADVVPGFSWHERETAELVGVDFDWPAAHPPLIRREPLGPAPLAHGTVMAARAVRTWPGAAEPGMRMGAEGMARRTGNPSRRRQRPPAVPDVWLEP